ncbi:IclR family transcriptional regulator [Brevibacterium sp. FAM 24638]|uniref:IclR family transcriptional regulator n=1 Tax=Brevibacterium sp. FAM 24638 TaxID=3415681 RepID=UPI003C7C83E0
MTAGTSSEQRLGATMAHEREDDHVVPSVRVPPLRHRMIARVAEILELAARESDGLSLTEFAQLLAAPVSSVQSLVNGLVETDYLTKTGRKYVLGPAPFILNLIARRSPINVVKHDDLELLHKETGRTAFLGIVVAGRVIYIDHVSANPAFAYLAETHAPRPLLRTAAGRVLLANMDKRPLFEILRRVDQRDQNLVEPFLEEVPSILDQDLAISRGLATADHWTVAVPVRENGATVAALGISGTPEQMRNDLDRIGQLLLDRVRGWSV